MRFSGKVVVVTGAARGIGRAIAQAFAAEGAQVFGADIAPEPLAGVETITPEPVDGVMMLPCDVADEGQVKHFLAQVGPVLHVLVNNAGLSQHGDLETASVEQFDRVLAVNLRGPYLMARHAAPRLRAPGAGAIINIASTRAIMSEPNTEAYAASKGGIVALTHALAITLGPSVRVNAILPGWIETSGAPLRPDDHAQHPVGRVGRPEDIAQAALFLADPALSGFMTGQQLIIDGGMTRKMIYVE